MNFSVHSKKINKNQCLNLAKAKNLMLQIGPNQIRTFYFELFSIHLGICFCPPNESNIYLPLAVFALLTPQKKF